MLRQLCFLFGSVIFISFNAHSQGLQAKGSVVVETPEDPNLSYRQRRGTHGALFSVFSETFDPVNYQSGFGDGYIGDLFGNTEFRLSGIELGYKYNASVGSLAALFSYGTGSGDGKDGRTLTFTKQSLGINAALDAIFDEPWVVPYGQISMNLFDVTEGKTGADDFKESTSPVMGYKYGLLFQLDWLENSLDPDARAQRLHSSGLENTFIDVYYANYMASSNAQDVNVVNGDGEGNLESTGQLGLGLKMEF
jgi:hypothetical protein